MWYPSDESENPSSESNEYSSINTNSTDSKADQTFQLDRRSSRVSDRSSQQDSGIMTVIRKNLTDTVSQSSVI